MTTELSKVLADTMLVSRLAEGVRIITVYDGMGRQESFACIKGFPMPYRHLAYVMTGYLYGLPHGKGPSSIAKQWRSLWGRVGVPDAFDDMEDNALVHHFARRMVKPILDAKDKEGLKAILDEIEADYATSLANPLAVKDWISDWTKTALD